MEFEIIGRHMEITPEIKGHVSARLEKVEKIFGRIHALKAILVCEGDNYRVEFVANLVKGDTVVARDTERDIYAAIDTACDKLDGQLRRYKDRLREHRIKTAETAAAGGEQAEEELE